jgi:hypothetical protein
MTIFSGVILDEVHTSPQFTVGGRFEDSDGKIYKYLEYKEGTAATDGVAGEVAYYYTLDGYKLGQVTSDLSDSVEIGAGVLQATMSDGEFGWFQIKGAATLSIALTAGADGDPLTPTGAADGTLDVSGAVTDNVCAIAGDISDLEIICDFPM